MVIHMLIDTYSTIMCCCAVYVSRTGQMLPW
jgi:hypothetical protein